MNIQELQLLIKELCATNKEKPWLEFKQNGIDHEQIGEYISALSNGACIDNKPFGYLVWGVEDSSHEVIGTTFKVSESKHGNQDLELWLRTYLHPKLHFEIIEFEYHHKPITLLKIPAATAEPAHFQKKAFIRINSNKTDLRNHPALVRKIYNSQEDWSAKICSDATLKDLDPAAIQLAREKYMEKNLKFKTDVEQWDEVTLLDKVKVTVNGCITNAALLLLGKPESARFLLPSIAQITWKLDADEKAYEHFGPPFLLNVSAVLHRIRNIRYKIFPDNQLIATEVLKYEPRVILEALNNCIAHQDYSLNSRIIVAEKTEKLIFTSAGSFFEGKAEDYSLGEKTPERYRNPWLAQAMVNLNMIDTMGYGIHTMFKEQRKRFFPLPDYSKSEPEKVILQIYGQVLDVNYSKLLLEKTELPLSTVIMLDRMQKNLPLEPAGYELLKKEKLVEGRKPNYHISASIAKATGQQTTYIRNKGIDDEYCRKMIIDYLKKFTVGRRLDFEEMLLDKLPEVLTEKQRKDKVKNNLQALKAKGLITLNEEKNWVLV